MEQVLDNPVKNQTAKGSFSWLVIISALMVTCYLTANIMAVKLISVFGITLFDAGTVTFPMAYMLGDVLTEVWGFKTAKKVIFLTFVCNIILVLATTIGVFLPSPESTAEISSAYNTVFNYVPRIVIASLAAFLSGELCNAWFMVKIKSLTKGRFLWIRTIGSSVLGYVFDTVIFVIIAFAGTVSAREIFSMITVQYFAKLGIEALSGTPLAYAAIAFLKRKEGIMADEH